MKRLVAKKVTNNELAGFIFNSAKEHIEAFEDTISNYIKKLMDNRNLTLEEMLSDEYELERIMINTLSNMQGIYDATVDHFFSNTPEEAMKNDPTNYDSPAKYRIDEIIEDLEKYGYNFKDLITPSLKQKLEGK